MESTFSASWCVCSPGEVLPYMDYIGIAAVKGMVFKQFTLG